MNPNAQIVIVGAGPAGLTAGLELQAAGVKNVTIIEKENFVGGISRTVNHHGNRIDIGGHRFFSKSDWVMKWWASILPVLRSPGERLDDRGFQYQGQARDALPEGMAYTNEDREDVMLVRGRLSRIYYNNRFFDYPLKLNLDSLVKLGAKKTFLFGISYVYSKLWPIRDEKTLEDFFINRFGNKLYRQFFKEYTEKVWGVPCHQISAAWGAQRIKSLSVLTVLGHALRSMVGLGDNKAAQTSLIESFIYPKFGPGQMWECAAQRFEAQGGTLMKECEVDRIMIEAKQVSAIRISRQGSSAQTLPVTHLVSTMPIKDLVNASSDAWPEGIRSLGATLEYRDFVTVGLLYRKSDLLKKLDDNWIYIQEPGVQVGRVQVFNNWSPYMVNQQDHVWLGLEFFCNETDEFWKKPDEELQALGRREMKQIGLAGTLDTQDAVVIRVPKAYPGYFGQSYAHFDELRAALDGVGNLFLIGRNGMHRYNNQDHSMLTAKKAVELIMSGSTEKSAIWDINVGDDYHESK